MEKKGMIFVFPWISDKNYKIKEKKTFGKIKVFFSI